MGRLELPKGFAGGTRVEALGRMWELDRAAFQGFQYFAPSAAVFMRFTFPDGAGLVLRLEGVDFLHVSSGESSGAAGWSTLESLVPSEAGRLRLGFAGGEVLEVGADALVLQAV